MSTAEPAGSAEFVVGTPAPALRPYVRRYIGYRQHDVTLGVHRGLPSGVLTLIISLADPLRLVGGVGAAHGPVALQTAAAGLHLAPALIAQDRHQHGLHLELNPLGVRALLGVSATELSTTVCDIADLPVPWRRDLVDRLVAAPGWPARFAILDAELGRAVRPVTLVAEVQWAWRQMVAGNGEPRITDLAGEIGWSRRHFSERFAREVGVTPKQAARLVRFEHSVRLLRARPTRTLADIAASCGYYDQAHLTGEWRQFAGCPPSVWIAEELPFLQDSEGDRPADSGS